ncbi:hypothetical protein ACFQ05_04410 [Amycolatopsis umgeniensis]|uniref:Uncharacterized protein n=1 Tax=Amycolatopsis umgeniensis TaxID=336628 RepID=A0A841AUG4_9PSEU|nr:hypothetical protein [Amycolatopsis umgeniensis]MBB5852509.1 hypothetical protein [Amycolatopsis umgeniensis]
MEDNNTTTNCVIVVADPAGLVLAIDTDCPGCGHWERTLTAATGLYGCTRCAHTSFERDH